MAQDDYNNSDNADFQSKIDEAVAKARAIKPDMTTADELKLRGNIQRNMGQQEPGLERPPIDPTDLAALPVMGPSKLLTNSMGAIGTDLAESLGSKAAAGGAEALGESFAPKVVSKFPGLTSALSKETTPVAEGIASKLAAPAVDKEGTELVSKEFADKADQMLTKPDPNKVILQPGSTDSMYQKGVPFQDAAVARAKEFQTAAKSARLKDLMNRARKRRGEL